ncbi:translational activator of cytochrome c oxidase 1-like isoform X2 [Antedon mediterranea]
MQAIKLAKDKGVPKATIENALTNTVKSKSNRYILEAKGPIGSLFVIDMSAEQLSKSKSELSKILNKHGGSMLDSGSALQIFLRKGILRVPTQLLSEEDAMDVAIEVGSENIEIIRDDKISVMFYCDPKDMREVGNNLISLKYPPESTTIDYIAESPLIVDDNNFKKISRLIEALEDHESVLKVYHNVTTKETDNKI